MPNEITRDVLLALRERVLAAKGADQELDARLLCGLLAPANSYVEQSRFNGRWCVHERVSYGQHRSRLWEGVPRELRGEDSGPSTSIDAALVLVRRLLPGTMWAVGNMEGGPFCRLVFPRECGFGLAESVEQDGGAKTEPLAIIASLLTALAGGPTYG